MFTTPTSTPVGGFLEGLANRDLGSLLRAAWLNYVSGAIPNALDAIGGGYYQLVGADLKLSSDTREIKINSPAVAKPVSLRGYVTIGVSDDVNYAVGVGTLTVSSAATFSAASTFSSTVALNGAVTLNAALTCTTNGDITLQSGCAVTGQSGSSLTMENGSTLTAQAGSTTTLAGTNTLSGTTTISGTTTLSGATTGISGTVSLTGRRILRRARVTVTDASQSINVSQGDRFEVPANNAAPRVITLTSTGTVPSAGECLEFIWNPAGAGGAGTQYTFQREDATVVATFDGSAVADTGTVCAEFEFAGGVWRLGYSSGTPYDGVASYGVIPGAGA